MYILEINIDGEWLRAYGEWTLEGGIEVAAIYREEGLDARLLNPFGVVVG